MVGSICRASGRTTPRRRSSGRTRWPGKATFTDEEVAELRVSAERLFGGGDDAAFADGVFNAVLADIEKNVSNDGGTGNYSSVWMVDREFENRTSLITDPADGKIPALTPEAEARIEAARAYREEHPADGPENRTRQVRCITYGIPRVGGLGAGYNSYYQILQTTDHLIMLGEMIHDARVIPIGDMPHASESIRQWHGDSRGHWEDDTLVVETTNYSPQSGYRGSAENLHMIERFTLAGPQSLHYEMTVTDPTTWTRPWTAMVPLSRSQGRPVRVRLSRGQHRYDRHSGWRPCRGGDGFRGEPIVSLAARGAATSFVGRGQHDGTTAG